MPPEPLIDLASIDTGNVIADREAIGRVNPHRFEFALLDGICLLDHEAGLIAGYRDVRDDEFWVRGHIPGRPIFPGVLMIETAAQLVSYFAMTRIPEGGFLGFGGVDGVKFRGAVSPRERVVMVGKILQLRARRCIGATQGFVGDRMVFEGTIVGMRI
ncbi:MAG TPA: beta-hydroxyacyl-ACP dehydratase [Phycisphaerae bacterium]|nr:beta-hydroxyacyl-ACP dehydratase [Phycisphaerae bacterium]